MKAKIVETDLNIFDIGKLPNAFLLLAGFSEFCQIKEKCSDRFIDQRGVYRCKLCEKDCRFEDCQRMRRGVKHA